MTGFRPLTGIKVSELDNVENGSLLAFCFRPLTGIKVSEQQYDRTSSFYIVSSFRPLTGIKVSELYILCHPGHDILYIVFKVFSVSDIPLITTPYYTINT